MSNKYTQINSEFPSEHYSKYLNVVDMVCVTNECHFYFKNKIHL